MTPPRPLDGVIVQTFLQPDDQVRFVMEGPASAVSSALNDFMRHGEPMPLRLEEPAVERRRDRDWSRAFLTCDLVDLDAAFPLPQHPEDVADWGRKLVMYVRALEPRR